MRNEYAFHLVNIEEPAAFAVPGRCARFAGSGSGMPEATRTARAPRLLVNG